MKRLSDFFARLRSLWQFSGTIAKIGEYAATYPGLADPAKLRAWLRPAILDCAVFATVTETTIDDQLCLVALKIVDSDIAWMAVYTLIVVSGESRRDLVPGSTAMQMATFDVGHTTAQILGDIKTENPALVIAAIGLLIQILLLRKRSNG